MLGLITGTQVENGYYEQSYKIMSIAMTVITSLNIVMLPRMSYLYKNGKIDEIRSRLVKSLRFVFFLAVPMMFGLIVVGPGFSQWFFGPGYEKVQLLIPIFAPVLLIITISNCLGGQCLTPCGKRAKSAVALWIGAAVNLIANLILIPHFASVGAAIGTIIAESIITLLYINFSRKYLDFRAIIKGIKNYIVAGIVMFIALLAVLHFMPEQTIVNTLIQMAIGAIVYGLSLISLRDDFLFEIIKLFKSKVLHLK